MRPHMLKGVTKKIVEIKNPENPSFERAVLYLRHDLPRQPDKNPVELAEEYLDEIEPSVLRSETKSLRVTVTVLSLSLGATLAALAVLLVLYTKM